MTRESMLIYFTSDLCMSYKKASETATAIEERASYLSRVFGTEISVDDVLMEYLKEA